MKSAAVVCLLAAALCGCAENGDRTAETVGPAVQRAQPEASHSSAQRASAPDPGDLITYAGPSQRDGAYTWHRAEVSETHALAALRSGRLTVTAPSGERLQYIYQRRIEHPTGEWTWIGRLAGGKATDQAIVTFGEDIAVGSFQQRGNAPLRLRMRNGESWLVETDRAVLASRRGQSAGRPTQPDFLLPPRNPASSDAGVSKQALQAMQAETGSETVAGITYIDLVLGYTTGYMPISPSCISALGRAECELRRQRLIRATLHGAVDATNTAFVNSGLEAQVRLLATVEVDYPDATSNESAIEDLTGVRNGRAIPVPAGLKPLRTARETYGADMVSLVRKFQEPEHGSCGIAWLNGQDRTPIVPDDARFAYSVVSDGEDAGSDGFTYFCSDDTLAHELGHNMGLQHERENAMAGGKLVYGAYAYAFGYSSEDDYGSHDIMAYGKAYQLGYLIYSKPNTDFCSGDPCGVAARADNARALYHTIPLVAKFRPTKVPLPRAVRNDLDADGISDIVFRHTTSNQFTAWFMRNYSERIAEPGTATAGLRMGAIANLNGDLDSEIIWTAADGSWQFNSLDYGFFGTGYSQTKIPTGFQLVGAADMDDDGKEELILHDAVGSRCTIWFFENYSKKSSATVPLPAGATLSATGDFDGDGREDTLWTTAAYDMRFFGWKGGWTMTTDPANNYNPAYRIAGAADVNGDGRSEVVLHNESTGEVAIWFLDDNAVRKSSKSLTVPVGYRWATAGDFTGTGAQDPVWTNASRQLLFTPWNQPPTQSPLVYAAGYRVADAP